MADNPETYVCAKAANHLGTIRDLQHGPSTTLLRKMSFFSWIYTPNLESIDATADFMTDFIRNCGTCVMGALRDQFPDDDFRCELFGGNEIATQER